jgi:hypothetical protein
MMRTYCKALDAGPAECETGDAADSVRSAVKVDLLGWSRHEDRSSGAEPQVRLIQARVGDLLRERLGPS